MREFYQNPLASRYASREMQEIFSDHRRYQIWRKLWLVLAEAEAEQGVSINRAQLQELREHQEDINYGFAALKEKALRNEVVAQLAAYSAQCGKASSILSLGAGADYVIENGDMIRLRAGLLRIKSLLVNAIAAMADFADENRALPCLAFRQMLPARVTTLGHRAACRLADLLADLEQLDSLLDSLRLHGCRGESGSASASSRRWR